MEDIVHQYIVFATLILALVFFIWSKWRYDIVSLLALLAVVITGVIPIDRAFEGFSHPAVIIVASMFIMSRALINSGAIDLVTRKLLRIGAHPILQLLILTSFTAVISAFINNIGALALIIPIAIHMAQKSRVSPALFLMPLAFASHLGGFLTLIGTPRNIIVSTFRERETLEPFAMFDFAYVGIGVTLVGLGFLSLIGWRLIKVRKPATTESEAFESVIYVTEVKIPEGSKFAGKIIKDLQKLVKQDFEIITIIRDHRRISGPNQFESMKEGDVLLVRASSEVLTDLIEKTGLELTGAKAVEKDINDDNEVGDTEAVVTPRSSIVGKTWKEISLRLRYGVNLLAVARPGSDLRDHLESVRFKPSDVLLLQGQKESIGDSVSAMGCLPLAQREIVFGRQPRVLSAIAIFVAVIIIASFGWVPVQVIFLAGALLMVMVGMISLRQSYESIDWPVIILLGSMITFGTALELSGASSTAASFLVGLSEYWTPIIMLFTVLVVSMLMSDFVNATASAVLMSPIAILIANGLGSSIDPFLMAVAIGASSAFLTPTGHESNTLVMGPGKYKFSDYWKVGLPLELLIIAVSMPLILYFWPLF